MSILDEKIIIPEQGHARSLFLSIEKDVMSVLNALDLSLAC